MRTCLTILILVLVLPIVHCNEASETTTFIPGSTSDGTPVRLEPFEGWPTDPIDILDAAAEGDSLFLQVRYSGGCVEHRFELIVDGILESNPAQAPMLLSHDDNGEHCNATIEETIEFDLFPLVLQRRQTTFSLHGGIILLVGDLQVQYSY